MYIVEHGKLAVFKEGFSHEKKDERPSLLYGAGSYFGELALLQNAPRAATVSMCICEAFARMCAIVRRRREMQQGCSI
jgi:hypothetical protein